MALPDYDRFRVRPVGRLAELFQEFQAPKADIEAITRRVGAVVCKGGLSCDQIRAVIIASMERGNGIPNWSKIFDTLGDATTRLYHGKTAFPK